MNLKIKKSNDSSFFQTASSAEYQMDEQFQNCQFLEPNFDFPN